MERFILDYKLSHPTQFVKLTRKIKQSKQLELWDITSQQQS